MGWARTFTYQRPDAEVGSQFDSLSAPGLMLCKYSVVLVSGAAHRGEVMAPNPWVDFRDD
jgi:hypothetical protein